MHKTTMSHTHCAVLGCKNTLFNKSMGISLHPFPTNNAVRNKWFQILKNRCSLLDFNKSRICSKHFEKRFFDGQRKLKDAAFPTMFPSIPTQKNPNKLTETPTSRTKIERVLNKLTQAELTDNIKYTLSNIKEPINLENYLNEDINCKPDAPTDVHLWILIKKQEHLNTRFMEVVAQNKKHIQVLQKNMEEAKASKKDMEQSVDTYKYIVKCLQEKLATLEEQIEILTNVESR